MKASGPLDPRPQAIMGSTKASTQSIGAVYLRLRLLLGFSLSGPEGRVTPEDANVEPVLC